MAETENYGLTKLFYSATEIKEMGLMSVPKLKQHLYSGEIKGIKNGRNWRVSRDELIKFIKANEVSYEGSEIR